MRATALKVKVTPAATLIQGKRVWTQRLNVESERHNAEASVAALTLSTRD